MLRDGRTPSNDTDAGDLATLRKEYLGFVVARPLPKAVIGRAVVALYEETSQRRYPVVRDYEPHLFGIKLPIKSLAFQQQDSVVAACATVALWSAFHKTQRLFDSARPSPAKITEAANSIRGEGRTMPSFFLRVEQMAEAIRDVGLEPETVETDNTSPLSSMMYGYVAMGIPVVLLLAVPDHGDREKAMSGHAVTVTGYSFGEAQTKEHSAGLRYIGTHFDQFFVHDDGVGPFSHMRIIDHVAPLQAMKERNAITKEEYEDLCEAPYGLEWQYPDENGQLVTKMLVPWGFIVPLDREIRLRWLDVHAALMQLRLLLGLYEIGYTFKLDDLEWDLRLCLSNEYKHELRSAFSTEESRRVVFKPYPKYIWRAVASTKDAGPIFEVTADATGLPDGFPFLDILYYDRGMRELLRYVGTVPEAVKAFEEAHGNRRYLNLITGQDPDTGIDPAPHATFTPLPEFP